MEEQMGNMQWCDKDLRILDRENKSSVRQRRMVPTGMSMENGCMWEDENK